MRLALLFPVLIAAQQPIAQERDKASLEGIVLNAASGEPLRKARLTLRLNVAGSRQQPTGSPTPTITVGSDAAGAFLFPNVEPGDYQLTARRDGFANVQLGIFQGSKKVEPIVLAAGDRKTGLAIKMIPYGAIAGRITDEDGDPIRGMQVATMVYQYTTRGRELVDRRSASTDDQGEYRIYDLPAGKYFLKASLQRMRSATPEEADAFATTYYPGAQDPSGAVQIDLAPGQQLRGMSLALRRTRSATIRGRVIAPPGVSVSAGLMVASDSGTSTTTNSVQDKDGKFELFGISPGRVYVIGAYTLASQRYQAMAPVQVGDADINGLELRPIPPMDVSGVVRIEGETATKVSEVSVQLQGSGRSYGTGSSILRDDGGLLFPAVDPNIYRVGMGRIANLYLKSVRWGTVDVTDSEIDLTNGVPPRTELAVVLGADGGEIEGTVKGDNSEPADSATVTLIPTGARRTRSYYKTAPADAAGRFTIKGVAPGSYKIFAWDKVDSNAVIYDPDFLRPYEGASQSLEVRSSERKSLDVKLTINRTP